MENECEQDGAGRMAKFNGLQVENSVISSRGTHLIKTWVIGKLLSLHAEGPPLDDRWDKECMRTCAW